MFRFIAKPFPCRLLSVCGWLSGVLALAFREEIRIKHALYILNYTASPYEFFVLEIQSNIPCFVGETDSQVSRQSPLVAPNLIQLNAITPLILFKQQTFHQRPDRARTWQSQIRRKRWKNEKNAKTSKFYASVSILFVWRSIRLPRSIRWRPARGRQVFRRIYFLLGLLLLLLCHPHLFALNFHARLYGCRPFFIVATRSTQTHVKIYLRQNECTKCESGAVVAAKKPKSSLHHL